MIDEQLQPQPEPEPEPPAPELPAPEPPSPAPEPPAPEPRTRRRRQGRPILEGEKERLRKLQSKRRDQIKLLMQFYSCDYMTAQSRHAKLIADGDLERILQAAQAGHRTTTPICKRCKEGMTRRSGRFGEFWGCDNYPECRFTISIPSEIRKISDEQKKSTTDKIAKAIEYIDALGGPEEALKYLNLATMALINSQDGGEATKE